MKYRLNESILLEAGEDDLGTTAPSTSTNNQTNTDASTEAKNGTNQNDQQTAPNENITDFKRAFAELDAKYAGKKDQKSKQEYAEESANLWSQFCKATFPKNADYVEQTLLSPIKLECKEYGYSSTTNPFIFYLNKLLERNIEPSLLGYGTVHNMVANGRLPVKTLRTGGALGEANILFSNNLLNKSTADIKKYFSYQEQLWNQIQKKNGDLNEFKSLIEFKSLMYIGQSKDLKALSTIEQETANNDQLSLEADDVGTLDVKVLQDIKPEDRATTVLALLARHTGTEGQQQAIDMLKKDFGWTDKNLIFNLETLGIKNKQIDQLIKRAGIIPSNLPAAIRILAKA